MAKSIPSRKLWWLNLAAGFVHGVSAIILIVLTDVDAVSPIHVDKTNEHRGNATMYGYAVVEIGSMRVGYLSGVFLLLAAIDHLAVATCFRARYEAQLARKVNYFRWIEYAASASIMHVMIAVLAGVMSLQMLFAIVGLTVSTMMFGLLQEMMNISPVKSKQPPVRNFTAFWLGCVPHCVYWIIVFVTYGLAATEAPPFVHAVMGGLFFTDAMFAVNMLLQQYGTFWRYRDYVFGEYMFIVLSFTAKSMLAWTNFGGTMSLTSQ
jgi:hypothetical protein